MYDIVFNIKVIFEAQADQPSAWPGAVQGSSTVQELELTENLNLVKSFFIYIFSLIIKQVVRSMKSILKRK